MSLYEQDLTLNRLQGLICHKTQPPIQTDICSIINIEHSL